MGFWDEFTDVGGGSYISADEKAALIENGVTFQILGVVEEKGGKYGDRYILKVSVANPLTGEDEDRNLGFGQGTVPSRDRMLEALTGYLGSDDAEPVFVTLEKAGQAVLIRKA
jgi:hypothetical protein